MPATDSSPDRSARVTLVPSTRRLFVDGEPARLGSRAFDLLCELISHQGQILGKRDLIARVWDGFVVEENNLQVQICALRKLLGPRAILTIPGRGYAIAAHVEVDEAFEQRTPQARPDLASLQRPSDALTPLRGREWELASLRQLLRTQRLVTVTGPGGVGKTRIVQATAEDVEADLPVRTVELAALGARASVATAVSRALALSSPERPTPRQLAATLSQRRLLVVLHNAEHVLDSVGDVVQALMEDAPGVRVVLTSQAPLNLRGEHVLRLQPLEVPSASAGAEARDVASMQMLCDVVTALHSELRMGPTELRDAISICRHLDGLPLALELAGARVPLLGMTGVRRMLSDRLRLLTLAARGTVPRQRSLQDSLWWSWCLLGDQERRALIALAQLPGPFGLRAARRALAGVIANPWQAMETLGMLVARSMVLSEGAGGERGEFRLLESTRVFVAEIAGGANLATSLSAPPDTGHPRR